MIITISGPPGCGKSTLAKKLAIELKLERYSTGDLMRQMAEEQNITLLEMSKIAENDRSIDEELDERQIMLGRNNDNFIIDGRLSWHFIPQSVKIYLDADFETRAKRIFADRIRQESNITLEKTKDNLKTREESEKKRYKEYYSLDYTEKSNYDLVIDCSNKSIKEEVEKVLEFLKEKK